MVDDIVLHRIKRNDFLPAIMKDARVLHTILWQKQGCWIRPVEVSGKSDFINESRSYAFRLGEGYVGRIYDQRGVIDVEILEDMFTVDPRLFLRKSAALLSGVGSIIFVNQHDGLLELSFKEPHEAREALPSSVLTVLGRFEKGTSFMEPSYGVHVCSDLGQTSDQMPSPPPKQPLTESSPSVGSAGHPHCCGLPCKYARIKSRCKDGPKCTRCHLCRFERYGRRR